MGLIQLIVLVVIVGVLLWAANTYIPMDPKIKQILNAVAIIAIILVVCLWFLSFFGIISHSFRGM